MVINCIEVEGGVKSTDSNTNRGGIQSAIGRRRRESVGIGRGIGIGIGLMGVAVAVAVEENEDGTRDEDIDIDIGSSINTYSGKTKKSSTRMRMVFTYGTLKKGFSNHRLMEELIQSGDASFVGAFRTEERYPLVCGPYRVPFLINMPGTGRRVWGELYRVSDRAVARMDDLEGTSRGHYERLPIALDAAEAEETAVVAYFAHRSYAEALWRRTAESDLGGYSCYSEEEARGYVRRADRPQHLSFLDHISLFLSTPTPTPTPTTTSTSSSSSSYS